MSAASLFPGYVKREIPVERDSDLQKKSSPVAVGACEETSFPSSAVEGLCDDPLKALLILFFYND